MVIYPPKKGVSPVLRLPKWLLEREYQLLDSGGRLMVIILPEGLCCPLETVCEKVSVNWTEEPIQGPDPGEKK